MNFPDDQFPFPAQPPDEDNLIHVEFNETWIPVLIGVAERLKETELFVSPPSDYVAQIDELIARLGIDVPPLVQVYPVSYSTLWRAVKVMNGNPLAFTLNTAFSFNGTWFQSAAAQHDAIEFDIPLAAGNYTLHCQGTRDNTSGIANWFCTGVAIGNIDWYVGVGVTEIIQTLNFTIPYDGLWDFHAAMNLKNAASAGYRHRLNLVWID